MFESAKVGVSNVGFAANSKLFNNAWQAIRMDGRYKFFDWTLKVDPDAVLMPNRLWRVLSRHTSQKTFIKNCGMFNTSAMYGSLEAVTRVALEKYFTYFDDQCEWMLWRSWGEDRFMEKCFNQMGVPGDIELGIVSDQRCWDSALPVDQGCRDTTHPAFHPLKSTYNWTQCWNQTVQAEGQDLRDRVTELNKRREDKLRENMEHTQKAMLWRKAQLAAGRQRREEEERRRVAKAEQEAEAKAARASAVEATRVDLIPANGASAKDNSSKVGKRNMSSMDDKRSVEYSIAFAKSKVVKEYLNLGDVVRVRDLASQKWRPGNVTGMHPVAVKPEGWTVGFTWDIVDIIPWRPESNFVKGDLVVVAKGYEAAIDVSEGPLGLDSRGVVQELRRSVSDELAVLVEVEGVQWWYRSASLALEHPLTAQTCKLMGCQVAKTQSPETAISQMQVKRRLRAGSAAPKRQTCRCDVGCIGAGRCCSDFIDTCLLHSSHVDGLH